MSGNKIGFNEITGIEFNGNYGGDLNSRLEAINDNFQKIANADYMKGVDGDDVRVLNASFANGVEVNPLDKGNLYSSDGEEITKGSLYTSISNCIAGLASTEDEKAPINGISWDSGLLENNSIMIIADEENGNYYLKSSLYFVYNDPRFANPTENTTYGSLKNLSCVVTYDGKEWVASQPFPKIYYSTEANDFCWEINGQRTGLIARGPKGLSGQNYPVWLCYSNSAKISDISTTNNNKTISIQIDGVYRVEGTDYNYITPPTGNRPNDNEGGKKWDEKKKKWDAIISKEEFKNNMALCIVHATDAENKSKSIIRLYCGYLYNQDDNLYIYTTQNSAIDTIIGHETLYSLLKSNSPGNTIKNSLFIPTGPANIDGSLSGKQIYSIYGLNETVKETDSEGKTTEQTYHTFNIGVSTVNNDQTLTQQIGRTKLNLWSNEINFKTAWNTGKINFAVGNDALQITQKEINIKRDLITDYYDNGNPKRHVKMLLPESYLTFESYIQRNLSDSLSPIDAAMNPEAYANRLSFYNPDLVDIEYSADGGGTWEDCFDNSDDAYKIKTKLLTTGFKDTLSNLYLGKKFGTKGTLTFTNKDKLRVSIYIRPGEFYGKLDKLNLYTSFRQAEVGELKMNCKIYLYKTTNTTQIPFKEFDEYTKNYYTKDNWVVQDENDQIKEYQNPLTWMITTSDGTESVDPTHTHENLSGEPGWNSIALKDSNLIGGYNKADDKDNYNFIANRVYKIVLEFGLEGSATTNVARVGGIRLFGSKWYVIKDKNGNTNSLAGYNSICSWDENGAAIFPSGVSNQFKITYKELKTLADEKKLAPGTKYRITDYLPKFNGTDIKSGEHQFDIIVEAVDNKTLSENANAVLHDGDTTKYFENSKLNKWELKYSLNTSGFNWVATDDPGVIYYMKDEFNNEAHYDFKNVMYVLNISNDDPSARNYIIYSLMDKYKTNIITKYLTDYPDQFDQTTLQNLKTWIQKGAQIMLTYNHPCLFYTFSSIYIDNLEINSADSANISCSFDIKTKDYSFTEFCYNNVLGKNSLYNIFIAAIEQSGISYVTKNNKFDINCMNNIFGENCMNNIFGENCMNNNFAGYCSFNCFENSCSNNNCNEYFKGNKLGGFSNDNIFGKNCGYNIIKSRLKQSKFGDNCDNNAFGIDVSIKNTSDNDTSYEYVSINFGNNCSNNNLGQRCYDINFGNNCSNNNLGQRCYDINFGNNCSNNNLGQRCYDINFGDDCSYNNLGQNCYDINFRKNCAYNNLGQLCRYIIFSSYCQYNSFGSNSYDIKTSSRSRIANCTIGNGCSDILFISPLTCSKTQSSIIYDSEVMDVHGAKIGNDCGRFIISIFKRITEGDEKYKNSYVSFLLYNTDSEQNYTGDDLNTLKSHKIFDHPIESFTINGLNISNGTDIHRVSNSSSADYAILVGLDENTTNLNMDDLDNIFTNKYMLKITGRSTEVYNFIALSCQPLITEKSEGLFHMKFGRYEQVGSSEKYMKTETIAVDWK